MTRHPRLLALSALALAAVAAPHAALVAQPQTAGAFYRAEIAAPIAAPRMVAGGVAWNCEGTTCAASQGTARPLRICRELKRKTGAIASFTVAGEPLPADELARCNA